MRRDWESGFCLGMANGDGAGFILAPLESLAEIGARAMVDLKADLAAMAAAEDMVSSIWQRKSEISFFGFSQGFSPFLLALANPVYARAPYKHTSTLTILISL